ncbi:unnamed protein product [Ilex paraguariensis]|uniref:GRF-type domain-containing protein n=1 Tax=Ilex paraguariensis TaxID=185542 RepID=A0ABC8U720_9AQUA
MESKGVVSRRKKKMEHMSCYCGTGTKMFTSWRYQNPGRRFLRCKNHKQSGGCGYFEWYDPSMCNQLKNIILDLLVRIKRIKAQLTRIQHREKMLGILLILTWIVVLMNWKNSGVNKNK